MTSTAVTAITAGISYCLKNFLRIDKKKSSRKNCRTCRDCSKSPHFNLYKHRNLAKTVNESISANKANPECPQHYSQLSNRAINFCIICNVKVFLKTYSLLIVGCTNRKSSIRQCWRLTKLVDLAADSQEVSKANEESGKVTFLRFLSLFYFLKNLSSTRFR